MTAEGRACTSVATIDTEIAEPANAAAHRAAVEPSAVSVPVLFATDGREPRRRRIADAAVLGCAVVALVLAGLASGDSAGEQDLAAAFERLLGWLEPLWTACYAGAGVLSAGLLVAAIASRRRALARDVVLAVAGALGPVGCSPAPSTAMRPRWPTCCGQGTTRRTRPCGWPWWLRSSSSPGPT
ncbi:MAG TPA: hypothetical protein VE623_08385 [Acidimicrobiales bacterium]|nr:hypothetical protein [Acidimicrobiales bacterium]